MYDNILKARAKSFSREELEEAYVELAQVVKHQSDLLSFLLRNEGPSENFVHHVLAKRGLSEMRIFAISADGSKIAWSNFGVDGTKKVWETIEIGSEEEE